MSSKKNFSESATYRYALALYELGKENSELDKIENQSKDVLNLLKNSLDFQYVAKDLTIKKNEQMNAIRPSNQHHSSLYTHAYMYMQAQYTLACMYMHIHTLMNSHYTLQRKTSPMNEILLWI